ncbi:putative effector [Erysiphe necator]|uniref:Putative effector n=1 Tax=Uncinula necator TaxID=52586 RepID=A0A0B1P4X0_UNCNE|nr:putative effector [Erysiphe necator]
MSKCFNTNLGEMKMFLGMRITRDRKNQTLWLDQQQYFERVLTKFGIPNAKHRPVSISLDGYVNLTPASEDEERIDPTEYSMIVGSLMFALIYTRPDIAFAPGRLSQYMKSPTKKHGYALKKLMRYLRYTVDYRLRFSSKETVTLVAYSDTDWATDKADRKSISGGLGMLCGAAIF